MGFPELKVFNVRLRRQQLQKKSNLDGGGSSHWYQGTALGTASISSIRVPPTRPAVSEVRLSPFPTENTAVAF